MLKDPGVIPELIAFLGKRVGDHALEECIRVLAQMGSQLIAYLEKVSANLNSEQWAEILYALKDIPEERTADLLLQHWNRLWTDHKESFIYALEGIASERFIEPLKKELREGEVLEEEAFYLLCHIHGLDDPLLPQIERETALRKREIERRTKALEGEKPEALLGRTTRMELKCRQCGRTYHYDVENIYVSKERKEQPKILDKIVCKNCRAVNQYEITPMGQIAMTSQLVLMTLMAEKGKLDPEASPIKLGDTGLMDGRRMSFDEALKYYETEVKASPDDPALRVGYGNILLKSGRSYESAIQFKEAIRLDPLAVEAYYSLGEHESDSGNPSKAYDYFRKAADRIHTGHYYKTKEIDQLKEAVFMKLEETEEALGIEGHSESSPLAQGLIRQEKVGRNAPCPCGSGKKYKRCCLQKEEQRNPERTSLVSWENELRKRLLSFSLKERYRKDYERACRLFLREPLKSPQVMDEDGKNKYGFFIDWFIHDYRLQKGLTIIDEFYQDKKAKLSEKENLLLKYEMGSYLSLYEVVSVTPEEGLRLKDLFTGEEMDVFEVSGTRALVKWDVIFTRVIRMGPVNKLSGFITVIPRRDKIAILSSIQTTWEKVKKETGKTEWHDFMKSNADLVHHLIEDQKPIDPIIVTEERHRILFSRAVFDVLDFEGVRDRVGREFDFMAVGEDGREELKFVWLKRGKSKVWETGEDVKNAVIFSSQVVREKGELKWSSLGDLVLTPKRLDLSCLSKERLEKGKGRLQELLGDDVRHRVDQYEDVSKKIADEPQKPTHFRKADLSEKNLSLFTKMMEERVMNWLDEKIPALEGKSPREAAQTSKGREKVEEMLRDWENLEERKRRDGDPYIDIRVIREMLSL